MAKSKRRPLSEITYEAYCQGVDAVSQLRKEGQLQIALSRLDGLRFIVDRGHFRERLAELSGNEVSQQAAGALLREIAAMGLAVSIEEDSKDRPALFRLLQRHQVGRDEGEEDEEEVETFAKKAEYTEAHLIGQSLRDRAQRLQDTPGWVLEDVTIELVASRRSPGDQEALHSPYLHITCRTSRYDESGGGLFFRLPQGVVFGPSRSEDFSLQCDEFDIDLLMRRLRQGKEMLAEATAGSGKGSRSDG